MKQLSVCLSLILLCV